MSPDILGQPPGNPGISFTRIPNVIFDVWQPVLPASEFSVLMCIARFTFGFHREEVAMGIRLIAKRTGLHKETVALAIKALSNRGLILPTTHGPKTRATYEIQIEANSPICTEIPPSLGTDENSICTEIPPSAVRKFRPDAVRKFRPRERKSFKETYETKEQQPAEDFDRKRQVAVITEDNAAAAISISNSENLEPAGLSSELRQKIAAASNAAVKAPPLLPQSYLIQKIWQELGGSSSGEALVRFMGSRGKRKFASHGIWLSMSEEFAAFAADEAANTVPLSGFQRYVPKAECTICSDTGFVGFGPDERPESISSPDLRRCECEAGKSRCVEFDSIAPCSKCRCELGYSVSGSGLTCVQCSPPGPQLATAEEIKAAFQELSLFAGVSLPDRDCRVCNRQGFVVENAGSVNVLVRYCSCGHGGQERIKRGEDWPAQDTARRQKIEIDLDEDARRWEERSAAKLKPIKPSAARSVSPLTPVSLLPPPVPFQLTEQDLERIKLGIPEAEVLREAMRRMPTGSSKSDQRATA